MKHELKKIPFCPVCGSDKQGHFMSAKDHNVSGDLFSLSCCGGCGFVYTNPIPTEKTIGKYYQSEEYVSHSGTKKGVINKVYHLVRAHQIKRKEQLIGALSNEKSLLDIGCGTGEFLGFCEKKGWSVYGSEPDEKARLFSKKTYIKENIYEKGLEKEGVSVITMWHVLEHVYNLNNDLNQINSLIKPGGHLLVAVPNRLSYDAKYYKNNWAAYDVPIHLYHFRKKDIITLFETCGFELVKVKPLIFDAIYISLLSEKKRNGSSLRAIFIGILSNLSALFTKNYSSLIYVLKKKE